MQLSDNWFNDTVGAGVDAIHPALLSKIEDLSITATASQVSPPTRLPFLNLKSFTWNVPATSSLCLVAVLQDNPQLRTFCVQGQERLPAGFAEALALSGSTLKYLQLGVHGLTNSDLHAIGEHCGALTSLLISAGRDRLLGAATGVTDAGFSAVAQGCPQLVSVRVLHFPQVSSASITALLQHCQQLVRIHFLDVCINDATVAVLAQRSAKLTALTCTRDVSAQVGAGCFQQVFSALTEVVLTHITHAGAESLSAALRVMRHVRQLTINISHHLPPYTVLSADVLDAIVDAGMSLMLLNLLVMQFLGDAERSLIAVVQRNLMLTAVNLSYSSANDMTDALLHALAQSCPRLQTFTFLCAKDITDTAVEALARGCPRIAKLALEPCPLLTNRSVFALAAHCPDLEDLFIPESPRFRRSALEHLVRSCAKLHALMVSGAAITDAAAERLQRQTLPRSLRIARRQEPPTPFELWMMQAKAVVATLWA